MEWVVEPAALDWARERLEEFLLDQVTSLVPTGFEAYARVLHPAVAGSEAAGDERPCRWREAAAWSGTRLGPSSTVAEVFTRLRATGDTAEWFPGGPRIADVGPELAAVLVELLSSSTVPGERCWFAVWEGYGWVWQNSPGWPVPGFVRDGPRAWRPGRSYVLYTGPLSDALALGDIEYQWRHGLDLPGVHDEVADLWWPQSRAWFVGADTDLYSTYVGATRDTIERLLDDPRLEVLPVAPTDRLA